MVENGQFIGDSTTPTWDQQQLVIFLDDIMEIQPAP
jgi:hypothetical protein